MLCYVMLCTYSILRTEYKTIYIKFHILFPFFQVILPSVVFAWDVGIALFWIGQYVYITIGLFYTTFERES